MMAAGSNEARRITSASDGVTYNGIACSPDGGRGEPELWLMEDFLPLVGPRR